MRTKRRSRPVPISFENGAAHMSETAPILNAAPVSGDTPANEVDGPDRFHRITEWRFHRETNEAAVLDSDATQGHGPAGGWQGFERHTIAAAVLDGHMVQRHVSGRPGQAEARAERTGYRAAAYGQPSFADEQADLLTDNLAVLEF